MPYTKTNTVKMLIQFTVERLNSRFHPFDPSNHGLLDFPYATAYTFPYITAYMLRDWIIAHVISVSHNRYCVDGFIINSDLTMEEKQAAATEAIESLSHKTVVYITPRTFQNIWGKAINQGEILFHYTEKIENPLTA